MTVDHPVLPPPTLGVLLVNLGTPDAPTPGAVRRYLAEFLSDRRVVELPSWLWKPILYGPILTFRPRKSARAYAKIWDKEKNRSPLAVITQAQAEGLADRLAGKAQVAFAMRYGRPSIAEKLQALKAAGANRILIAPLYPQYCAATTATVVDAVGAVLAKMRWQPTVRTLPPYYDDPAYIEALATTTRAALAALPFEPEALLLSFHGMPKRTLALGDPYHCHCAKTARLLRESLGFSAERAPLTFQSRFGPAQWLEPYTVPTLEGLARQGVRRVAVVTPGFAADCLETLEELALGARESFLAAGGTHFAALPCLNDQAPGMAMLEQVVLRELSGWLK